MSPMQLNALSAVLTLSNRIFRDVKVMPAKKYTELMSKAVELSQYKEKCEKLRISMDKKNAEIKHLRRIIQNYENRNMNKTQQKDIGTTNTENIESENLNPKVNSFILFDPVFI